MIEKLNRRHHMVADNEIIDKVNELIDLANASPKAKTKEDICYLCGQRWDNHDYKKHDEVRSKLSGEKAEQKSDMREQVADIIRDNFFGEGVLGVTDKILALLLPQWTSEEIEKAIAESMPIEFIQGMPAFKRAEAYKNIAKALLAKMGGI